MISLQNVDREHAFSEADERLLATLAGSLSVALENARLVHETRQRNAELALINSVQDAIAGELDPQAIYDLVGDKIQEIFDAQVVDIAMSTSPRASSTSRTSFERGERLGDDPIEMTPFRQFVLDTRRAAAGQREPRRGRRSTAAADRRGGASPRSGCRLSLGGSGRGWISLQNLDREHAFTDSDVQLLSTLAGSLGVALENARLVHETRQRNAELALINSVQAAIAGELDPQAIYDIVGDKIQEVFDAQVVDIGLYDEASGSCTSRTRSSEGCASRRSRSCLTPSASTCSRAKSRSVNESMTAFAERTGSARAPASRHDRRSWVPLAAGGGPRVDLAPESRPGARVQRLRRAAPHTLAGSLSVALDNARLVHETRQRNAELALINSVQDALAGELELQAIYDVVGDKIQEVFDAQVVDIADPDESDGLMHFPYIIERGEAPRTTRRSPLVGFRKTLLETQEPLLVNEFDRECRAARHGCLSSGEPPNSALCVPLVVGGKGRGLDLAAEPRPRARVQRVRRAAPRHARRQPQRRARERAARARDEAAGGRARGDQQRPGVDRRRARPAGDLRRRRREAPQVFDAQVVDIAVHDEDAGLLRFVYQIERGVHFPNVTFR